MSADAISLMGMACALPAGAIEACPPHGIAWLGLVVLVQGRLLANLLDGMVAIGSGTASPLGELLNELPDRVSDTAILAGLGYAAHAPALGWAAAAAAMATAYVRVLGRSLGQPADFRRPMAKQQRMVVVTGLALWCAFAPVRQVLPSVKAGLWVILVLALVTSFRRTYALVRALER